MVISAIPPFIYSVGPGNHFMLLDPDVFFALFFVAGNFRSDFSCHPFLFRLIWFVFFKDGSKAFMSRWREKRRKRNQVKRIKTRKRTGPPELRPSETPVQAEGSAHKDQSTGNFMADTMIQCINEIKQVEAEAAAKGQTPKLS